MRWAQRLYRRLGPMVLAGLMTAACSSPALQSERNDSAGQPFETTGLAGEWAVSDGTIEKTLVLDCHGTGRYEWQDGKVVTETVRGPYWTGSWQQPGNDREGGFEVVLSDDRATAEGRWWYSRIGNDRFSPGERGGTFSLTRPTNTGPSHDECRSTAIHEALGPH